MFVKHFKMTGHPFSEGAPVDWLMKHERIREGLARLEYFSQEGSLALITGHTGVGKSSLIKLFLESLSRNLFLPVYIYLTHVTSSGLLRVIVTSLGEEPRRGKERLFFQILEKTRETDLVTIIIVDESHLIEPQALTDLRLLVSELRQGSPKLKLILSGQDSLRDQLKKTRHADLVHRISVRYHIPPLTREQTTAYIDFQMKTAGASDKVFEPESKSLIHDYSSGFPRQINNAATVCLINAAARESQKVSAELVNESMSELHLP